MRLHEAARALSATAVGADVEFDGVATDSRDLPAGCLFVALRGPRFDGHAFAGAALAAGAAAVMVANGACPSLAPALVVDDTRLALGRLAAWHRQRMNARVAAITGSNGKTTVKEMLAAILAEAVGADAVLATRGNLNNDIGVPLTLLRLTPAHRYAVVEMGMNHAGEIDYLTHLARPDVALVNNALRAHLQGLGGVGAIARAKGEIYAGLKDDGIALINADDAHAGLWRELAAGHRIMGFGFAADADVRIRDRAPVPADDPSPLQLDTPVGPIETMLAVPGTHNLRNAAAAAAAALALGIDAGAVARGLAAYRGTQGRLRERPCLFGGQLIDDSYNANPDSVLAAIQVLAARAGTRILVLGDMGELGAEAAALHAEVGAAARAAGIDRLLCLGELSIEAVRAFGAGAMHFERIEELLAEIECALAPGVTVLVKGSRFMKMERVVNSFVDVCPAPADRGGHACF